MCSKLNPTPPAVSFLLLCYDVIFSSTISIFIISSRSSANWIKMKRLVSLCLAQSNWVRGWAQPPCGKPHIDLTAVDSSDLWPSKLHVWILWSCWRYNTRVCVLINHTESKQQGCAFFCEKQPQGSMMLWRSTPQQSSLLRPVRIIQPVLRKLHVLEGCFYKSTRCKAPISN